MRRLQWRKRRKARAGLPNLQPGTGFAAAGYLDAYFQWADTGRIMDS
ncbi:hypothetical protein [Armatimonas sp.]|nr:hypothetical protein [Armatimonas sp.]